MKMNKTLVFLGWGVVAALGAVAVGTVALRRGEPINALWLVVAAACCYSLGYRFYSGFIAKKILALDGLRATPAERLENGRDFLVTNKWVVFGHHFAAIAGPGPLVGPVLVLSVLRIDNNLYVQIGIILLMALSAKNAILIVEMARVGRVSEGRAILEAAVDAARSRFRPIIMTSFAFILGVVPLVLASGAGASARKSIGITVFSGMIASTCLAVLFVPSLFVVVQRFEEWRARDKAPRLQPAE